jgi:TRAP transporter 4TM/12TM fusion protein
MRKLKGYQQIIVYILGVFISLFSLYTAAFGVFAPFLQRSIHVGALLPMVFLLYPASKKHSPKDHFTVLDAILAVVSMVPCVYVMLNKDALETRMVFVTHLTTVQIVMGVILILCMIEAVRRSVSGVMAGLVVIGLVYLYFGPQLSGLLHHSGLKFERIVEAGTMLTDQGVFGSLMGTSATFIIVFCIFGAFAVESGAGAFFTEFARAVAGHTRGSSAKIATISAGLFGTMTGSAVATVYTTGTFTIPMMKRGGFSSEFSGAVSAVASTGGQLMPPIMGAAAFLLAENLGITYGQVAAKSAVVAILYYFSLFAMIHFKCLKENIRGETREELPELKAVLKKLYLFIPIVLLLVLLLSGVSTLLSGLIATAACFVVSFFDKENRMTPKKLLKALYSGGKSSAMCMAALGGAGLIVVAVTYSGLALSFSSLVVSFSHGSKFLALLLVAVACMILGMGVPSTAAYVIASALGCRILIKLGVSPFAAHMFVFYFAIISNITPPVAVAAYAAANVAESRPMRTGVLASLLAVVAYIVPFVAAYNPALLMEGTTLLIVQSTVTAFIGVFLIAGAIQGYFITQLDIVRRVVLAGIAFCFITVGTYTDLLGVGLLAAFVLVQKLIEKKNKPAVPTTPAE